MYSSILPDETLVYYYNFYLIVAPKIGETKHANAYINPYISLILSFIKLSNYSSTPTFIYKSTCILSIISGIKGKNMNV
jgi:hypothetical protein